MSKSCLLGYTGYVGSTLLEQASFDDLYNSSNIEMIKEKEYDFIVCAAAPAVKWKANQSPQQDLENINRLIESLNRVKANKFVLISTVDVFTNPINVDEDTIIEAELTEPYGRHRYYLEEFVKKQFDNSLIIRLPGLFGKGLKKNYIYDLIHDNALHLTHYQSEFQFYNMDGLWEDIQKALSHSLSVVNFSTEPVSAKEIAQHSLGLSFLNETERNPVRYDMKSKFASIFNPKASDGYMKSRNDVLTEVSAFILQEREQL